MLAGAAWPVGQGRAGTALEGPAGWVDWAGKFLSGTLGRGTRGELGGGE